MTGTDSSSEFQNLLHPRERNFCSFIMSDNSYVSESQRNIDLLLTDYLGQLRVDSRSTRLKDADLQSPLVDEYRVPMSSLQALRLIHTARPALIHGSHTPNDVC